jgi:hypothetical protein
VSGGLELGAGLELAGTAGSKIVEFVPICGNDGTAPGLDDEDDGGGAALTLKAYDVGGAVDFAEGLR